MRKEVILFFISLISLMVAMAKVSQKVFKRGTFDFTSASFLKTNFSYELNNKFVCSLACQLTPQCTGFSFNGICNMTDNIPARTSQASQNQLELWRSDDDTLVPHFLIIRTLTGEISDVSASKSLSLPVKFNATWPITGERCGPYILGSNLTIKLMLLPKMSVPTTRKYVMWNLGESSMKFSDHEILDIGLNNMTSGASLNNVMFLIGCGDALNEAWGYVNFEWRKLKTFSNAAELTCASFVADDENFVYFSGGSNLNDSNLHEYRFDTDSYSVMSERSGQQLVFNGCAGYKDDKGLRYFVTVGGLDKRTWLNTDMVKVQSFNFTSKAWIMLANYPVPIVSASVVANRGVLYVFGGKASEGQYLKVNQLSLRNMSQGWTLLTDLDSPVRKLDDFVIPYV